MNKFYIPSKNGEPILNTFPVREKPKYGESLRAMVTQKCFVEVAYNHTTADFGGETLSVDPSTGLYVGIALGVTVLYSQTNGNSVALSTSNFIPDLPSSPANLVKNLNDLFDGLFEFVRDTDGTVYLTRISPQVNASSIDSVVIATQDV